MSALTQDRNTPMKDGELVSLPVAASVKCIAGGIAVIASGYVKPGVTATGLIYVGRFEETVDNSTGSAGDKSVLVRRGKMFKFANSGTDAVAQANVGGTAYVEDDQTVAKTDGTNTRSAAGKIMGLDSDGVWVL